MKWFKHDSNAHSDAKLKRLKHKCGIIGYGIYWYCIELIASRIDKDNVTFELEEDAELIALEWSLDQLKVQEIMEYMVGLGLFENAAGKITCLKLANRLDESASKNPQIRRIVNSIREDGLICAKSKGYTYLIQSGSIYKIGMTTNLHNRLASFKTTNPNATLLHTIESVDPHLLESTLHKYYSSLRTDGEWFELSVEDVNDIKNITNGDEFIRDGFPTSSGTSQTGSRPDKIRLDQIRIDKDKNTLVENSTEKIKSNKIPPDKNLKNTERIDLFERVWKFYGKKGNRCTSLARFLKLKSKDLDKLLVHVKKYVASTPDIQYRKGFESYIVKQCWNDEIVENTVENNEFKQSSNRFETPADRAIAAAKRLCG